MKRHHLTIRLLTVFGLALGSSQACQAFYFPGWPGDGLLRPQRLTPPHMPTLQPKINPVEGIENSVFDPPPYLEPERVLEPEVVPEPGTLPLAIIGVCLLGGGMVWKLRS